jgi:uncharacterized membrane protein
MAKQFFSNDQQKSILNAIQDAEKNTSGEVQVHIENRCKKPTMDRAVEVFAMLKMQNTQLRNGVLFYLAIEDHKFAILGDAGINSVVPHNFWESIKENMQKRFKEGNFTEGLTEGIQEAGRQLKQHFPFDKKGDKNELSDDISFGKN